MGIGRREFLKLFGAALAAAAVGASPAAALLEDWYINRKLGIAFRKYPGWQFANVADLGMMKDGQILALEDADLAKQLKEKTDLPLITISKDSLLTGAQDFTPGINIYLYRYDLSKHLDVLSSIIFAQFDIVNSRNILKDFAVITQPAEIVVSGCQSVQYVSSFLFEHVGLIAPTPVRMNTLLIAQNPAWYTLRMYDSPWCGAEKTIDYTEFVDNIQMI